MPSFSLPLLPPQCVRNLNGRVPRLVGLRTALLALLSFSLSLELSGALLCGALPHLTSPAAGFANSSLSCALGNCRHKTDAAALFMAAFL